MISYTNKNFRQSFTSL